MLGMQFAIVEWAKQPAYTIPHWVETCNATLAAIFEGLANTFGLCPATDSNEGCSGSPDAQTVTLRMHCAGVASIHRKQWCLLVVETAVCPGARGGVGS